MQAAGIEKQRQTRRKSVLVLAIKYTTNISRPDD